MKMDEKKAEFVNLTVINTPKPTASSTVDRKSFQKKMRSNTITESSFGITDVNTSKENIRHSVTSTDLSFQLQQQHLLANSSLQRANKVTGLPSKYLRPNMCTSTVSNIDLISDSTINESDLTKSLQKSPRNTSTPRTSVTSNDSAENCSRLSLGQSMAQLSYQIGNTDISIDNFVKEFQKAMGNVDNGVSKLDSQLFSPAEEVASMLLADEMSWRRQNEMPPPNNFSQLSQNLSYGQVSMGAFFQQKSDTVSDLEMALSPTKMKNPVPLIDCSASFSENRNDNKTSKKSLSISAIRQLLTETEDTPRKLTNYLLKQGQVLNENLTDQSSLPVSKNSSYTSNYSENEAMRNLVSDKENSDIYNAVQKDQSIKESAESVDRPLSSGSSRSLSSALTSLPNGKLPIESTRTELIWGCVKVGKCATQDFLLRNRTSKRLCLQMSVPGHDFKIRKDNRQESEPLSAAKILLNPHECRAVIVSFIPTKIGAAVDELRFSSVDTNLQQTKKQSVKLYGYGGFGKLDILNLTKDITGKFLLCLGKLDNRSVLIYKFAVKNTGTLPCFAHISYNPKALSAFATVSVAPAFTVLIPREQKDITVSFAPTMEDHQILQRFVFSNTMVGEIGNLHVTWGAEVNRGRLRRQCRKSVEKGLDIDPLSDILKKRINGEAMPADLYLFKEAPGSLREILKLFTRDEVVVTIEQDPEVTIMPHYPDESGMYRSLCQDSTIARLETTTVMQAYCKLEPASLILTPPIKTRDSLFLVSECKKKLHFKVISSPEGLEIFPTEGMIGQGQEIIINVACGKMSTEEKKVFKVLVYIENEVIEAVVKITFIHSQSRRSLK